jgi:hypothetical protein
MRADRVNLSVWLLQCFWRGRDGDISLTTQRCIMNGRIGKFKVGDLVTLSSYGKSTNQNSCVTEAIRDGYCVYGMITRLSHRNANYPINVEWVGYTGAVNIPTAFFFREIKYYRGAR